MMKFIYGITFLVLAQTSFAASAAKEIDYTKTHTCDHLVAFSIRKFRDTVVPLEALNTQKPDVLDPTYTKTFKEGKVCSLDLIPAKIDAPHIQGDVLKVRFDLGCLETLVMELPPSVMQSAKFHSPEGKPDRCFLPSALKRSFFWLKPGGKIFIEHFPFSSIILNERIPAADIAQWNQENPFHGFLSLKEAVCIRIHLHNQDPKGIPDLLAHCPSFNPAAVDATLEYIWNALAKHGAVPDGDGVRPVTEDDKKAVRQSWSQDLRNALTGGRKPDTDFYKLFLGVYTMHAQKDAMKAYMENLGYTDVTVGWLDQNPYNGRTHVWAIQGTKKPAASAPTAAGAGAGAGASGGGGGSASGGGYGDSGASAKAGAGE